MSGHWPDRPSSALATICTPEPGSPGKARAAAREAGTAPDAAAFLKNEALSTKNQHKEPLSTKNPSRLQLCEHLFRRVQRRLDHRIVVRARHESRFERRRCEIHTADQHSVEELLEALDIALRHFGKRRRHGR